MGKDRANLKDRIGSKRKSRRCLAKSCCIISSLIVYASVVLLMLFLVLIFGRSNKDSELYLLEIGDVLGNSSSFIIVDSSYTRSSAITFSSYEQGQGQPYTVILLSENVVPSPIMDHLPLEQFPLLSEAESEYREAFNYLGGDEPIYLLSGSSITYNVTISSNTSTYPVCLYLFTNETHYNTFLVSVGSSNVYQYSNSLCLTFMSTNTTTMMRKGLTTASFSFNITSAGQYYVGIQLQSGVAVQANASVVRIYYNTTGLQQQTICSGITSCSIDLCSTFVCTHEAITSFLIKPFNRISMKYFFTSPKITVAEFSAHLVSYTVLMIFTVISVLILSCIFFGGRSTAKSTPCKQQSRNSASAHEVNQNAVPLRDRRQMKERLLIQYEFLDGSGNDTLFSHTYTSSNNACTIDATPLLPEVETVQVSLLQSSSCDDNIASSSQPQFDKESMCCKHSLTNRTSDEPFNTANAKLFLKIKDAFGELQKLSLDRSGLVYHCSQYGVTLIIPEGAVQESATVWFGACLFSDKFKFGDYVPVTPIVWVHIDRKLDKCAELYIPHDVALSSEINVQQFTVLTADDNDLSDVINFQENNGSQFQVTSQLFEIFSPHFCSNCVAVQEQKYKSIPRRYLIARADKKNGSSELLINFIFLCRQKGCKKVVEEQCAKEGFQILSYEPVTFTGDGHVSLSFEPHSVPGWKREEVGFTKDYISMEDIDYYQMMGCENASEVTKDELDELKFLEDLLSYPPRFRIQFTSDAVVEKSQKVIVRFNQVHPSVKNTILLEGSIELPISPTSSRSSTGIDIMTYENDLLLGDCLCIIASEGDLKEKWFDFGYRLGLNIGQLNDIELISISPIQRTRKVIIYWRNENRSESWEPLAAALAKIGFKDLAHRVKDHFESLPVPEPEPEDEEDHYKGVYCNLCKDYHLKPEDMQQEVYIPKINSSPDIVDFTNLVAAKIQDKFYQFGTALRLNDGFLKSLYDTYHDPMDRFIEVFNRWKYSDPDTCTWATVIKVLQSDAIGAHAVAQDVMKRLTTIPEHAPN